jgi:hypothetical protein
MIWWKQTVKNYGIIVAILGVVSVPSFVVANVYAAPTYTSPNYGVDEVFMGAGGLNDASSTSYRARASLGDLAAGNSSSTNYQVYGGFTTTPDPYLELTVTSSSVDLGYLSTSAAATTTNTFSVRTYLASGYIVTNASDPPTATSGPGSHTLTNLTTQTASSTGTEQFGVNLVANTSPTTFGAAPSQIPDSSYSFGQVNANYATTNQYRYNKGDTIAYSTKSSGTTAYTISYLYNISDATPAGEYVFNHVVVATSTF